MGQNNGNANGTPRPARYKRAEKTGIYARVALCGPSNSGKSYTALRIAKGLAGPDGKVFVLDTERGRIKRYADEFEFYEAQLTAYGVDNFVGAIDDAENEGAAVLIIDSGSHAWMATGGGSILDRADELQNQGNGNKFSIWSVLTPEWSKLLNRILGVKCHTIVTVRCKTKWEMESYQDARGNTKNKPVKVGSTPVLRDGTEYEFDVWGDLNVEHVLSFGKTCEGLPSADIEKPGPELGAQIREWCGSQRAESWRAVHFAIKDREAELEGDLDRELLRTWFEKKFEGKSRDDLSIDEIQAIAKTIGGYIGRATEPGVLKIALEPIECLFDPDDPEPSPPSGGAPDPSGESAAETTGTTSPESSPADNHGETALTHAAGAQSPAGEPSPSNVEGEPGENGQEGPQEAPGEPQPSQAGEENPAPMEQTASEDGEQEAGESLEDRFDRMGRELYGEGWRAPEGPAPDESDDLFGDRVESAGPSSTAFYEY